MRDLDEDSTDSKDPFLPLDRGAPLNMSRGWDGDQRSFRVSLGSVPPKQERDSLGFSTANPASFEMQLHNPAAGPDWDGALAAVDDDEHRGSGRSMPSARRAPVMLPDSGTKVFISYYSQESQQLFQSLVATLTAVGCEVVEPTTALKNPSEQEMRDLVEESDLVLAILSLGERKPPGYFGSKWCHAEADQARISRIPLVPVYDGDVYVMDQLLTLMDRENLVKKYIFSKNLVKVKVQIPRDPSNHAALNVLVSRAGLSLFQDVQDTATTTQRVIKTVADHALKVGAPRPAPISPPDRCEFVKPNPIDVVWSDPGQSRRGRKQLLVCSAVLMLLLLLGVIFGVPFSLKSGALQLLGVSVGAVTCPSADPLIPNELRAARSCGNARGKTAPVGTECVISCIAGFRAAGEMLSQTKRTCSDAGIWTGGALPQCTPEPCTSTLVVPEANMTCSGSMGDACVLQCGSGFSRGTESASLVCGADHMFRGNVSCKDIDECATANAGAQRCTDAEICTNFPGSYDCASCISGFSRGTDTDDGACLPRCVEAGRGLKTRCSFPFTYAGSQYNDCTDESLPADISEGETWCSTGPGPSDYAKCIDCSDALMCPPWTAPENGGLVCTPKQQASSKARIPYGDQCTVVCNDGYGVVGPFSRTCLWNQSWSESVPAVCEERCTDTGRLCQFPFSLNGVEYHDCTTAIGPHGTDGSSWCATGSDARTQFAKCVPCTSVDCGQPENGASAWARGHYSVTCNSSKYADGGTCEAQCNSGYYDERSSRGTLKAYCEKDHNWRWIESAPNCQKCRPGSVTNTLHLRGAATCSACPSGKYSADPISACAMCPEGEFQQNDGRMSCTVCSSGSMVDTLSERGGSSCTACDFGRYSPISTVACAVCHPGSTTNTLTKSGGTTCTTCVAGQYSSGSTEVCRLCQAGSETEKLLERGSSNCTACASGMFSTDSTIGCKMCAVGQYQAQKGNTSCEICHPGSTVEHRGATCTACGIGQYSAESAVACAMCSKGSVTNTLADSGGITCMACSAGQYSPGSTVACHVCPDGSATDTLAGTGGTVCTVCEPGKYSANSRVPCTVCGPGSVTNAAHSQDTCRDDDARLLSQIGSALQRKITCAQVTSFYTCDLNSDQYSTEHQRDIRSICALTCGTCVRGPDPDASSGTNCTSCEAGQYSSDSTRPCTDCPAGSATDSLADPGGVSCTACEPGQFSQEPSVACALCKPGSVTDTLGSEGGTICTACDVGQYSGNATAACHLCLHGWAAVSTGSHECRTCASLDGLGCSESERCDVVTGECVTDSCLRDHGDNCAMPGRGWLEWSTCINGTCCFGESNDMMAVKTWATAGIGELSVCLAGDAPSVGTPCSCPRRECQKHMYPQYDDGIDHEAYHCSPTLALASGSLAIDCSANELCRVHDRLAISGTETEVTLRRLRFADLSSGVQQGGAISFDGAMLTVVGAVFEGNNGDQVSCCPSEPYQRPFPAVYISSNNWPSSLISIHITDTQFNSNTKGAIGFHSGQCTTCSNRLFISGLTFDGNNGPGNGLQGLEAGDYGVRSMLLTPLRPQCTPGHFSQNISAPCGVCPAGTYSSQIESRQCTPCSSGSVTDALAETGGSSCTACEAGQFSLVSTEACTTCSAGSVTDSLTVTGGTNCTACDAGQYSPGPTAACAVCPAGSATDKLANSGGINCTACVSGKYSSVSTGYTCQGCTTATYTPPSQQQDGTCWQADTSQYSCSGYETFGYHCADGGRYCAAIDPSGNPETCASQGPPGSSVDIATGRCIRTGEHCLECPPHSFSTGPASQTCECIADGSNGTVYLGNITRPGDVCVQFTEEQLQRNLSSLQISEEQFVKRINEGVAVNADPVCFTANYVTVPDNPAFRNAYEGSSSDYGPPSCQSGSVCTCCRDDSHDGPFGLGVGGGQDACVDAGAAGAAGAAWSRNASWYRLPKSLATSPARGYYDYNYHCGSSGATGWLRDGSRPPPVGAPPAAGVICFQPRYSSERYVPSCVGSMKIQSVSCGRFALWQLPAPTSAEVKSDSTDLLLRSRSYCLDDQQPPAPLPPPPPNTPPSKRPPPPPPLACCSRPCQNGGTCVDGVVKGYTCECAATCGDDCEITTGCDPCEHPAHIDCGSHGSCTAGACECTDRYSGSSCETKPQPCCAGMNCCTVLCEYPNCNYVGGGYGAPCDLNWCDGRYPGWSEPNGPIYRKHDGRITDAYRLGCNRTC